MTAGESTGKQYPMPFVRIELVVLSIDKGELKALLGLREQAPYKGRWALPGGVLRIDLDRDLYAACQRVAQERLQVPLLDARQLMALGGRTRDPRAPWSLSVAYSCTLQMVQFDATPGKRLGALKWVAAKAATQDRSIAFDHGQLISAAVEELRHNVDSLNFPHGLMPESFTLGELQAACEAVLGHPLDKSSFRRRIASADCLQLVDGQMKTGAFRPAQVFELKARQ
jgi:8-oxo-dGTP diphosphatase